MGKTKDEKESYKKSIVKRRGRTEEFDERKVYGSVYAASASARYDEESCEKNADAVTQKVKNFLKDKNKIDSLEIRKIVISELKKKGGKLAFFYKQHLPNLKKL